MAVRSEDNFANFVTWAVRAMEHARTGHAEDALANLRKAGEAAAKTIIAHRWADGRADKAIAGARFAKLVHTIDRHRLAPEDAVRLLKTLQVEGNAGAHDERVRRGRAALGAAVLHELAKWLCDHLLGRRMPAELSAAFEVKRHAPPPPPSMPTEDPAQDERMAGIEAALADLARRTDERSDGPDPALIEAINALHTRLDAMERPSPAEAPTIAPRRRSWKWPALTAAVVLVGAGAWWALRPTPMEPAMDPGPERPYDPGALNVLLIPLTVVQDDPNLRMDLPAVMAHRIEKRIREFPWAGSVTIDTVPRTVTPTAEEAWAVGRSYGADLVIYGDLLEPTGADSGRLVLGHVMRGMDDIGAGEYRSMGFRTMADAGVDRSLATCVWWYDLALAERMLRLGDRSQALRVLQHAAPNARTHEIVRRMLLAQCFASTGNHGAALREALWCREQGVDDAGIHLFLAELFRQMGDHGSALQEAEQAVRKAPADVTGLLLLADLLVVPGDMEAAATRRADRLVEKVLELDTDNARAWFFKGASHSARGQWDEAVRYYERSLALDATNVDARMQLAFILAKQRDELERALWMANEVIAATDSNHVQALELAGRILTHTRLADPRAAMRVLDRLGRSRAGNDATVLLGQGQAAMLAGDDQRAVGLLERSWQLDSMNVRVAGSLALALMRAGRHEQGRRVALAGLAIDSLDTRLNMHLGELYRIGPAAMRDDRQADKHLTRALLTDAHDPYILNLCGEVRMSLGHLDGAAAMINAAYRLAPDDHQSNRNMGNLEQAQGDPQGSIPYYRRALDLRPRDNETASNLAWSLLQVGQVQEGLHWSQRSVDLARSPENLVIHARLLLANARPQEAAHDYREAVAGRPGLRQHDLEQVFGRMP